MRLYLTFWIVTFQIELDRLFCHEFYQFSIEKVIHPNLK
jgi:hypothetical protein